MDSAKTLIVGGKVVVIGKVKDEFDAFEALIVKKAITNKSVTVIRLQHADQALKEHGVGWMEMVVEAEDNEDLIRIEIEKIHKATKDVNAFIVDYKRMAEQRKVLTKQMEALAGRYGFHVSADEFAKKKAASKKKEASKKEEANPAVQK